MLFRKGWVWSGFNKVSRIQVKSADLRLADAFRFNPGSGLVKKDVPKARVYPIEKIETPDTAG